MTIVGQFVFAVVKPLVDLGAFQVHARGQLSDFVRRPVSIKLELGLEKDSLVKRDPLLFDSLDATLATSS